MKKKVEQQSLFELEAMKVEEKVIAERNKAKTSSTKKVAPIERGRAMKTAVTTALALAEKVSKIEKPSASEYKTVKGKVFNLEKKNDGKYLYMIVYDKGWTKMFGRSMIIWADYYCVQLGRKKPVTRIDTDVFYKDKAGVIFFSDTNRVIVELAKYGITCEIIDDYILRFNTSKSFSEEEIRSFYRARDHEIKKLNETLKINTVEPVVYDNLKKLANFTFNAYKKMDTVERAVYGDDLMILAKKLMDYYREYVDFCISKETWQTKLDAISRMIYLRIELCVTQKIISVDEAVKITEVTHAVKHSSGMLEFRAKRVAAVRRKKTV